MTVKFALTITGEYNWLRCVVWVDDDLDGQRGLLLLTKRTDDIAPVYNHVGGLELWFQPVEFVLGPNIIYINNYQ